MKLAVAKLQNGGIAFRIGDIIVSCPDITGQSGETLNLRTGEKFRHATLTGHFAEPFFSLEKEAGYYGLPHRQWVQMIHETLHAYLDSELFANRGLLMNDMTDQKEYHRPYYVIDEILAMGIETAFNQQFQSFKLDNSLFLSILPMLPLDQRHILAEGLKICDMVIKTMAQHFA